MTAMGSAHVAFPRGAECIVFSLSGDANEVILNHFYINSLHSLARSNKTG